MFILGNLKALTAEQRQKSAQIKKELLVLVILSSPILEKIGMAKPFRERLLTYNNNGNARNTT